MEKELATAMHEYDQTAYVNPYALYGSDLRLASQTDSLLAIAYAYDSLILKTHKTDYSGALQTIRLQVERRKNNHNHRDWQKRSIDSFLVMNGTLDMEFRKYALRVKLSRVLETLQTQTCGDNGMFLMMELHPFLTYRKKDDRVEGEFGWGYVVTEDLGPIITLTHNGQKLAQIDSSMTYQKTEATFIPKDTGTHILTAHLTVHDPITDHAHQIRQQRSIYIKP